ncbi:MAG: phosphate acyltransferase, partial [Synergistales bacterium]|nr:phosphate acyltransferase [Synergistales bacterium]
MEQIRSLNQLLDYAKSVGPRTVAVAAAEDAEVLEAVENARSRGIAKAVLVGDAGKIAEAAKPLGIDLANYDVVDVKGGH